jgi:plasmid stabilization system protein ParE
MAVKIEWTDPVLQDLKTIVSYIEIEWSEAMADRFVEQVLERLKVLAKQPYMGMASTKHPSVRSIKVSKHNKLYYRFENDTLILLSLFDTRQHPDKNLYR